MGAAAGSSVTYATPNGEMTVVVVDIA